MKKNFLFIIYHLLFIISVAAQGTPEDYRRAYAAQRTFSWNKVLNHADDVRWLSDGRFQYHVTDGARGTWHFGQVNADGSITLADSTATRPIEDQRQEQWRGWGQRGRNDNRDAVRFIANPTKRRQERHWMETDDQRGGDPVLSPDSSLVAFIRNDNVYIAKPDGSQARALSTEGTLSHYFSSYIQWSPDSRYVAVNRIRPVDKRYVYYVESSPADQLQPILHKQEYAKPGDELPQETPYIFEVATGRAVTPYPDLIANQYALDGPRWCEDSHAIRFEYNQRGHHLYRVYEMAVPSATTEVNASSVESVPLRTLIEESEEKYVRYSNNYRRNLRGDSLILWLSERDGFPHLYLFNTTTSSKSKKSASRPTSGPVRGTSSASHPASGPVRGGSSASRPASGPVRGGSSATTTECPSLQLTSGPWCVRRVLHIDEAKGFIIFTANGRNPDEDPYHIHYYRIGLDGKNLIDLTPEPGNHNARFNSDFTALIDTYSTQDTPPVTKVRSVCGDFVATKELTLATADITPLLEAGWVTPEIFVAPGRDGTTPMWGIIQRPTNFDPTKKYPVIEYIYAGPGDSYVPKSFQPSNYYTTALAELGFIVVQLDAMGTSNRGKKFEEVCYKNLKDAGFPDRIAWMKAAAAKYPYMDIDRVGIYGCSAGGQESTAAVLFHGDFYKAAYSACGCHDNRMDKIWWNEQWMSYPIDSSYVECSNVENAYRLERPLMLVVGELDDNVDPASTMQVASALIKANKPFELVVIPGAHHTVGEAYGEHKRYDFFVKHLLGVEPPAWSDVKTH